MLLLAEEPEELNVLETPWYLREHAERIIDPALNPRVRKWLIVSDSEHAGEGQTLFTAGPFWADSPELDRQVEFFRHIIRLQNDGGDGVVPKPRNPNREASGRFGSKKKSPEDGAETL